MGLTYRFGCARGTFSALVILLQPLSDGCDIYLDSGSWSLLGLPVDLWVVLLEPDKAKDDILPSHASGCKGGVFRVVIELEDCIHDLCNGVHFIWSTIYIVDQNGTEELPGGEAVAFHTAPVHELSCGTTVYKS